VNTLSQKKTLHNKKLVEWLKVEAQSSSTSITKKKKITEWQYWLKKIMIKILTMLYGLT
jgi:hypothetical protein